MTSPTSIVIRPAGTADSAAVREILLDAASWLKESGAELWKPEELTPEVLRLDVAQGLFILASADVDPAGTMKFQLTDEQFWPDVPQLDSTFIHRLAVKRRYSGGLLSSALLQWAADRTSQLGRRYLRLDCDSNRTKLRSVYERFGFRWHSDRQVGPFHVARYVYDVTAGADRT